MCFDFITNISHSPGCDRKLSDYYENHCLARTVIMLYISYIVQYNTASAIKFTRPGSCLGASFCFSFLPMRTAECGAATNSVGCALQFSNSFFFVQKMEKGKSLRLPTPVSHSLQSPAPPLRWRAWNSILLQVPRKSHANRPRTGRDWSPHMAGIARGRLAEERRSWRKARHRGDCMFLCLILLGLRNECMRPNSGPPLWLCCQVC